MAQESLFPTGADRCEQSPSVQELFPKLGGPLKGSLSSPITWARTKPLPVYVDASFTKNYLPSGNLRKMTPPFRTLVSSSIKWLFPTLMTS